MAPSLTVDFLKMVDWSLNRRHTNAEYTERLGLPQTEASKHSRGYLEFEGEQAVRCMALYKLILEAANKIADRYTNTADLESAVYQQDALSINNVVELLLKEHGPHIWGRFNHTTRIYPTNYPHHLCYFEDDDRKRLVETPI
jgi:hypothetical protein